MVVAEQRHDAAPASRTGRVDATTIRPVSFDHHAALDGLRGLAVAAVLAFHADLSWAVGGYLGVSAFFTLSGFLITTLLLTEHARRGHVDLGAFWVRRVRRLLPAAIVGIGIGVGYVVAFGDATALGRVRGDALAALGYVANWRFILGGRSYAELFSGDSPLQHLWSLAIEEQFYVVLPIAAVLAFRAADPVRRLAVVAGVGLVASVATSVLVHGADRLYYGTDTRAAELLVGVLAACAHHQGFLRRVTGRSVQLAGAVALAALIASWAVVDQTSSLLHPWLLLAHAGATVVVVFAAIADGRVTDALAARPLVRLGVLSYGVYLYHWPIYLWLDRGRTGLADGPLLALRLAVTLTVAVISFRLVESPIRRGRAGAHLRVPNGRVLVGAGVAVVAAAGLVVATTLAVPREPLIDFSAAEEAMARVAAASGSADDLPPITTTSTPGPSVAPFTVERPRVSILGDSTALLFVPGLIDWAVRTDRIDLVEGFAVSGCGLTRDGERIFPDATKPVEPGCAFDETWPAVIARARPQIALVEIGLWDVVDRRIPGVDETVTIGDPVYDAYLRRELDAAAEVLLSRVERVVWVLQPPPINLADTDNDPVAERLAAWNDLLLDQFADEPRISFVDVDAWLASTPDGTDSLRLRPDGTHFSEETSVELAEWLGPAILEAVRVGGVVGPDDVP